MLTLKRHPESSAGRETPEQEARWDAEMLAYTVYAADDAGGVTTWDLKPLLLNLIHSCVVLHSLPVNIPSHAQSSPLPELFQYFQTSDR